MGVPYTTKEDRRNERYTEEERERIFELYASGMSIADIATRFKRTERGIEDSIPAGRHIAMRKNGSSSGATLCELCKYATNPGKCNTCSWTGLDEYDEPMFKPVEGWTAVHDKLRYGKGNYCYEKDVYTVKRCPLFVRG